MSCRKLGIWNLFERRSLYIFVLSFDPIKSPEQKHLHLTSLRISPIIRLLHSSQIPSETSPVTRHRTCTTFKLLHPLQPKHQDTLSDWTSLANHRTKTTPTIPVWDYFQLHHESNRSSPRTPSRIRPMYGRKDLADGHKWLYRSILYWNN